MHATSVCERVLKLSPDKIEPQKHYLLLSALKSENMPVTRNTILISPHRLLMVE